MAIVELADGRSLEYFVAGPEGGTPLVLHSGTPSAAVIFEPLAAAVGRHGLRLVVYSRPGYAGSTPQPGRTVASAAADVAAVLDEVGAERFYAVGWSGGGPHALACAALLPGRCLAAASIAGVAPYTADGLDWAAGMGPENVEEFGAAVRGTEALTPYLEAQEAELAAVRGEQVAAALGGLVSEVDQAALTGEYADYVAESFRAAVSTGIAGWLDDDLAFVQEWGFDLEGAAAPVSIWQGGEDRMVPYAHGEWLAARVPQAAVHLHPGEGHLSLMFNHLDDIVTELIARGG
ncbi:alpha/beta fold hydrolase [Actinoplanes sp. NPDC049265]|uniref:alpha/beta fold hydrolase n=1 Tax=Actinoplanes sp. NPDC049265 TaxID=3363902 RepID=UPI0037179188